MPSANYVHFSQLVDRCVTRHYPPNIIEHTHDANILISTLERQVS